MIFINKQLRVYFGERKIGLCRRRVLHESEHLRHTGGFINTDRETEQEKGKGKPGETFWGVLELGILIAERESQFLVA